jgi:hypothetical protein
MEGSGLALLQNNIPTLTGKGKVIPVQAVEVLRVARG